MMDYYASFGSSTTKGLSMMMMLVKITVMALNFVT